MELDGYRPDALSEPYLLSNGNRLLLALITLNCYTKVLDDCGRGRSSLGTITVRDGLAIYAAVSPGCIDCHASHRSTVACSADTTPIPSSSPLLEGPQTAVRRPGLPVVTHQARQR